MSVIKLKSKIVAKYAGHSIKQSGAVNLSFTAEYSELHNTVMLTQLLNNDISIAAKLPDEKPMKLGSFRIKQLHVSGDGSSKLVFDSLNTFVEVDNLNRLVTDNPFQVQFAADVDTDGEAGESEGDE